MASAGYASAGSRTTCARVAANEPWQGTGVQLQEGDFACVRAQALWSHGQEAANIVPFYGPQGYFLNENANPQPLVAFPFARLGALIGKIGDAGNAFPIENGLCFAVEPAPGAPGRLPGELQLSMNDVPGGFANNQGSAQVAIAVERMGRRESSPTLDRLVTQAFHSGCGR